MSTTSPRDPYRSFVVAASAGSGKTYQLSRRFLFLVAAGAEPGEILTVTFTRKAAGEMRQRILEEAGRLALGGAAEERFAAELESYRRLAPQGTPTPRRPRDAARLILGASQALAITTIDGIFLEWVAKFAYEAGLEPGAAQPLIPAPFELLDESDGEELERQAWRATCTFLSAGHRSGDDAVRQLLGALPGQSLRAARSALRSLDTMQTAIWHAERTLESATAFALHEERPQLPPAEVIAHLSDDLKAIAAQIANDEKRERVYAAVAAQDLDALLASELITADIGISGNLLRGKKRDLVGGAIAKVEETLQDHVDAERLARLNVSGAALYSLYRAHRAARDAMKLEHGRIGFPDLVTGAYRLFHNDAGVGVRFLLARTVRHLLLDEFQDTSRLQWSVFAALANELTAGDGSVFLVGDAKQSIYGFREADPAVIATAATTLAGRVEHASLTSSYRTAQVVLDIVNAVFTPGLLPDFPAHATALGEGEAPVVPDAGRVLVAPLIEASEVVPDPAATEAELIAATLERILSGALASPVFDKELGRFRPIGPGDCAILYRSGTNAELFEAALRARGIPCHKEEQHGFYARPEVADALALLRFLCIPCDLTALLTVLRSPLGRLSDRTMLELLSDTAGEKTAVRPRLLLDLLADRDPRFAPAAFAIERALDALGTRSTAAVLRDALAELAAAEAYAHPLVHTAAEGDLARRNLARLVEIAFQLEDRKALSPSALLARLDEAAKRDETGNAPVAAGSVSLMTIHKSKGLEFPFVAVVDAARPWAQRDLHWIAGPGGGVHYVGTKADQPLRDPEFAALLAGGEVEARQECARLLYVAMTRARQYLMVTGHLAAQTRGLKGTSFYPELWTVATSYPTEQTIEIEGLLVRAISSTLDPSAHIAPLDFVHAAAVLPKAAEVYAPLVTAARVPPPSSLPAELKLVTPSADHGEDRDLHDEEVRLKDDALPDGVASLFGTLVHLGLQAWLEDKPFVALAAYRALTQDAVAEAPAWLGEVQCHIETTRSDAAWTRLTARARRIRCELPLVHHAHDGLVVGALDALVETEDGRAVIVDFKSSIFAGRPGAEALQRFARRRGYDAQLARYGDAVAALLPEARVETLLYFTGPGAFVAT